MSIKINVLKNSVGCWFQLNDQQVVNLVTKNKEFKWSCFDFEHGFSNLNNLHNLIDSSNSKINLVRLSIDKANEIPKILDLGADGIIVANPKSKEDIKKIVNKSYFPPIGKRGIGFSKYNSFFFDKSIIRSKPIVICMIENLEAYKNLEFFLNEKNINGLFIGPADLSASMGKFLNFKNKKFLEIIKDIKNRSKKSKKLIGKHVIYNNTSEVKKGFREKFDFLAFSTDTYILQENYRIKKN